VAPFSIARRPQPKGLSASAAGPVLAGTRDAPLPAIPLGVGPSIDPAAVSPPSASDALSSAPLSSASPVPPAPGRVSSSTSTSSPRPDSPTSDALFQVGELAKLTGKTVRAIHLYEEVGLLKPQDRSKGRFRLFSADSVLRVRWISKLQELGLSLAEIQELARVQEGSGSAQFAATRLREVYRTKLEETRNKLQQLATLEGELEASLAYLETCDQSCVPQVPVDGCHRCRRHRTVTETPDLVAGVRAH
jgi:MerR family copper efflux transcriptional regulator